MKSKLLGFPGKLAELQRILLQKLLVIGGQAIAGFLAFAMVFIIAVEIAFLLETAASFFTSPFDSDDSSDYGDEIDGYQGRLESGHLFEGIFYTSVYADEGGGETESDPPYKYTALRIVYNELLREEKLWAGNLKNVFTDAPRLEDLYYTDFTTDTNANDSSLQESVTDDHIDISLWASEHGYTYYPASDPFIFTDEDGNERSGYGIKGTQPFNNAPLAAYKWIKKMDGGVNVRFMGGTGQNLMTSNVQEIIAMAMVAQEQTDMGKEEDEADPASDGSGFYSSFADWVANFFTSVRNFFANLILGTDGTINNSIPREWFQDWWDKHMAYEESKAYMIYCKPLFDQSHREGFSLQMSLLPTRWTEGSVYSTYNTTIGYTYGNLETVDGTDRPAVSVENTVPEAEYNQLKATALSYGRVKIEYSDADLDMAARVVYHEAGPSDRAGAVAVAEVLYNQVLQAAYGNGKGYTTSIITNINKYFVPWFASGTWNPNSAVNKSIKEMCRNVFDGIEFVSGNTYMLSYAAYSDHSSPSTQGTFGADPVYACDYPAVSKQTFYRRVSDRGSNLPAPLGSYDTVIGMNVAGVTLDSAAEPGTTGADSITGNATGRTTEVAVCTGDDDGSADLADFESYGFGCMTYDRFFFKDHNSTDMYYGTDVDSSEKVPQVASESYVIYAKETGDLYESEITPSEMNPADTENKSGTGTEGQGDAENKQVIIDASGTHFEVQDSGIQVLVDADRNPIRYLSVVAAGEDGRKVHTDSNGHRLWIQENDDLWPEVAEEYEDAMPDPAIHYGYQVLVDQHNVPILVKDEFSKDESQTGTIENEDSIAPVDQNTQTIIMDKEIPEELRERYDHRFVCVAPNGKTELFLDAFENNDDCWIPEFTDETMVAETPEENDNQTSNDSAAMIAALGDYHSKIWQDPDKEDGYIYAQSEGDGEIYYIWIVTNSDKIIDREYEAGYEEGFDEEGNWYPAKEEVPEIHHYRHTLTKVTFTHHCAGNHRGYYCGGHLLVDTTGIIFHITEDERNNIENPGDPDNYVNKVTLGSDGVYRDSYGQSFSDSLVNEISDDAVDQDRIRGAKDLFDIDLALKHQRGGVSESFQGWTASEIEEAASKLLDDWYALYGIYVQDSLAEDYGYSSQGSTFDDASGQSVHVDFSGIPERDYSSMVSALASSGGSNFSQYINTKTKITTITDVDSGESRQFFNEQQSYSAAWKNCRYPTNMISEGCFLYAAAAAVSNLKNEPYLVADACAALSGQGWTFDESGNRFVINGSINSENLTVGGSITRLNKILQASGSGHHATSVLNSGAAWNSSLTQQVMQGKTALIYATQSAGSRSDLRSGSAHWTYIAGWFTGDDGTPWAIILCNGNRFNKIRFSDIGRLKYVYMID